MENGTQWGQTLELLEEKDKEIANLKQQLELAQSIIDEIATGGANNGL